MDVLSQILDGIEMCGYLYFPAELRAAFGLRVPAVSNVCRFHVVVEGGCYLSLGAERIWMERGDLALVPHGREHLLQDDPETPVDDLDMALEQKAHRGLEVFSWGDNGAVCRLVCGHFEFDQEASHPILEALPRVIHVPATPTYDFRWMDQVMRFMGEETHSQRPGSAVISRRLSEVLFVQVIRHYAENAAQPAPILAGIVDPRLSRALHAMHTRLGEPWTLETLARESGMSRTAFAVRFNQLIGCPPITYLTGQRMGEAARRLRADDDLGTVAERVGYKSEAAFARKFKELTGFGPGAYRRRRSNP